MQYTEEVGARFSAGMNTFSAEAGNKIHRSLKEYTAEWNDFVAAAKAVLEGIRSDYCCGRLGFYLARHFQLDSQANKPGNYLQKNAGQYARALNKAGDLSRTVLDKEFWEKRLLCIFQENLFLLPDSQKRPFTKQDILDICRYLGISVDDSERILLSVLENEGFSYLNSSDLVEMFLLQVQGTNEITREQLRAFCLSQQKKNKKKKNAYTVGQSQQMSYRFEARLRQLPYGIDIKTACNQFKEWVLAEDNLDKPSRTAQLMCQKLLLYIKNNMTQDLAGDIMLTDDDIFEEIRAVINTQDSLDLSESDIQQIVFLATEQAGADSEYAQKSWAYPTIDENGRIAWSKAQSRLAGILEGHLFPQKNDVLFILYRAYVMKLETICDPICTQNRYADFVELSNMILKKAFLPPFYPPHMLECSIGQSLLSGALADDLFRDIVDGITDVESGGILQTEPPKRIMATKKKPNSSRGSLDQLTKHLCECAQKKLPAQVGIAAEQYNDARALAQDIFKIWSEKFLFGDIAVDWVDNRLEIHTLQAKKPKSTYVEYCVVPQHIQEILCGARPVEIKFYSKWTNGRLTTTDALVDMYIAERNDIVLDGKQRANQHKKVILSVICAQVEATYLMSSRFATEQAQKSFSSYPKRGRITIAPPKNKN